MQGQLTGQWADELKSTWKESHLTGDSRRYIVEVVEVISIDRKGEAVLAEMMSQGAEFIATDVYTKHLLWKLRGDLKRTGTKGKQGGKHR